MILDAAAIRELVPHAGAMCLLDGVEFWDSGRLTSVTGQHRSLSNPLRVAGGLSSLHGIELAAQAMALHGALVARAARPRAGLLVSVRNCRFKVRRLDDVADLLQVTVTRIAGDERLLMYEFAISGAGRRLVGGRASVVQSEEMN